MTLSLVQLTSAELEFLNTVSDAIQSALNRRLYTTPKKMGQPEGNTRDYRQLSLENSPVLQQPSKSLKTQIITTEMKPILQPKVGINYS